MSAAVQPPAEQGRETHDAGYEIKRDDLFHYLSFLAISGRPDVTAQLRLWQKPVNEQRVQADHRQGKNYD